MAAIMVTLGGVAFRDFEVPQAIEFGGCQRLAVHELPGGGRVIDTLGAAAGIIRFAGTFSGPDAEARAQLLDVARAAGATLPLAWSGFAFEVVIADFVAVYEKPWWIPFSIELVEAQNLVTAVPDALAQAGLDLVSAGGLAGLAGLSLGPVAVTSPGSIAAAQGVVGGALSAAESGLAAAQGAFGASAGASAATRALQAMGTASLSLAALGGAAAYLGRAAGNASLGAA